MFIVSSKLVFNPFYAMTIFHHLFSVCVCVCVCVQVCHEYVIVQGETLPGKDGPGVLILSEFAGSAQSLSGALRINPWNTEELAEAIHKVRTRTSFLCIT